MKIKPIFFKKSFLDLPMWFWLSILFFSLAKIILTNGQRLFPLPQAIHDDRLFINLANSLLKFDWLGHYNNLTLAKGPVYPMWIAFNSLLGFPLLLSQQILYILSVAFFILVIRRAISNQGLLLLIYVVLIFNPMSFCDGVTTRTIRENIYPALTLFIISSATGLFLSSRKHAKNTIIWSVSLGVLLSLFWLTREEGIWILSFLVPVLLYLLYALYKEKPHNWRSFLLIYTLPFLILFFSTTLISTINYYKYGIFSVVEFKNKNFLDAYGSLMRVKDKKWEHYLLVSREKRNMIYEVSPTFAKLQPFLEGNLGNNWAKNAAQNLNLSNTDEIRGGWFMWAFRDAVSMAGYYKNGKSAMNFYKQLAQEINLACEEKKLDCFPRRSTMAPSWNNNYIDFLINSTKNSIIYTATFDGFMAMLSETKGNKKDLDMISKLTNEPVYISEKNPALKISGWAFQPDGPVSLSIKNKDDQLEPFTFTPQKSQDVYESFSKQGNNFEQAKNARFEIFTDCESNCYLSVKGQGVNGEKIPLDGTIKSSSAQGIYINIDKIKKEALKNSLPDVSDKFAALKIRILNIIASIYIRITPVSLFFAFIIFTFLSFKKSSWLNPIYLISAMLLLAVATRIFLIALIDATSFPTIMSGYLSPVHPIMLLFISLIFILFYNYIFKKDER